MASKPWRAPMPWQTIPRARVAVTLGSFWRSEPAAALRGLANIGLPASAIDALSRSNASTGRNTSPRTSISAAPGTPCSPQPVRDRVDRLDVGRDVLARAPVASGQRTDQAALLVEQVDGEAVDLELAEVRRVDDAVAPQPRRPGLELLVGEGVVEALHPLEVVDRGELGGHRATDLLGRRVGRAQVGDLVLELLEAAHPLVEVGVGERRVVEDVVAPARLLDLLGERAVLLAQVGLRVGLGGDVAGLGSLDAGGLHSAWVSVSLTGPSCRAAPTASGRAEDLGESGNRSGPIEVDPLRNTGPRLHRHDRSDACPLPASTAGIPPGHRAASC